MEDSSIKLFNPFEGANSSNLSLQNCRLLPVRAVILTSARDTLACDLNGQFVQTGRGLRYMEGAVERLVRETLSGGSLHGLLTVVAIINDDREKDMAGSRYPHFASKGKPWMYPLELLNSEGHSLFDITRNIFSHFRGLPLSDTVGRQIAKAEFEGQVLKVMQSLAAHILISDHYMARLVPLITELGYFGRVLNIHPAVTLEGHPYCFRGQTPTADAIARAQAESGICTGATLHLVDEIIDHGPPLAYMAGTPVFSHDKPQHLRYRNYQAAKLPLFITGMLHYISTVYPCLLAKEVAV